MAAEEETVGGLVARGRSLLRRLEAGKDSDRVDECVEVLEKAWAAVTQARMFATKGDLSDGALRCALVPFYRSRALERSSASGPLARLKLVERVDALQRDFLTLCASLDLLDRDDLAAWDQQENEPEEGRKKPTPAEQRKEALLRSRRRDEKRLKFLQLEKKESAAEDDDGDDVDDRDVVVAELAYAVAQAVDDLRLRKRELDMLRMMAARLATTTEEKVEEAPPRRPPPSSEDEAWLRGPHDGQGIRVLRMSALDGRLEMTRDRIRAKVFTPDPRRLPTKSLEEFADEEMAAAIDREQKQKEAEADPSNDRRKTKDLERDGDEDDEHKYDDATRRDEEWDTWREHHPRGAGNKGNHIY